MSQGMSQGTSQGMSLAGGRKDPGGARPQPRPVRPPRYAISCSGAGGRGGEGEEVQVVARVLASTDSPTRGTDTSMHGAGPDQAKTAITSLSNKIKIAAPQIAGPCLS